MSVEKYKGLVNIETNNSSWTGDAGKDIEENFQRIADALNPTWPGSPAGSSTYVLSLSSSATDSSLQTAWVSMERGGGGGGDTNTGVVFLQPTALNPDGLSSYTNPITFNDPNYTSNSSIIGNGALLLTNTYDRKVTAAYSAVVGGCDNMIYGFTYPSYDDNNNANQSLGSSAGIFSGTQNQLKTQTQPAQESGVWPWVPMMNNSVILGGYTNGIHWDSSATVYADPLNSSVYNAPNYSWSWGSNSAIVGGFLNLIQVNDDDSETQITTNNNSVILGGNHNTIYKGDNNALIGCYDTKVKSMPNTVGAACSSINLNNGQSLYSYVGGPAFVAASTNIIADQANAILTGNIKGSLSGTQEPRACYTGMQGICFDTLTGDIPLLLMSSVSRAIINIDVIGLTSGFGRCTLCYNGSTSSMQIHWDTMSDSSSNPMLVDLSTQLEFFISNDRLCIRKDTAAGTDDIYQLGIRFTMFSDAQLSS